MIEKYIEMIKKDINNLDVIISQYKDDLYNVNDIIELEGKELTVANAQHVSWTVYYGQKCVEVKTLKDYMETVVEFKHGELWRKLTEKSDREYNDKAKGQYINSNEEYLNIKQQYLKIQELYEQFHAINDGFKSRGYVLNNLTKIICTEHSDWIIQ